MSVEDYERRDVAVLTPDGCYPEITASLVPRPPVASPVVLRLGPAFRFGQYATYRLYDRTRSAKRTLRTEVTDLITQVRQRACLWDRSCAGYRNRVLRDQAWREVGQALYPDYGELSPGEQHEIGLMTMRKWYNIRDAFKKTYSVKGNSSQASRPYLYAELLDFLIPIFKGKDKQSDAVKNEAVNDDEDNEHEQVEWLNVFELDQAEATPPKRNKPDIELVRVQSKERTEADDSMMSVLVNLLEKEEDEDRAFFKSITPAVKSLPDDVKFMFRIRVMELLDGLKKNSKNKKPDGSDPIGVDCVPYG